MEALFWARAGAWLMLLGVGAGAFGAHGLRSRLTPEMLSVWETAVRYQIYHALALLALAGVFDRLPPGAVSTSGWCFFSGVLIFSGSLYALSLSGLRWLGAITPVGGLLFLAGWALLIVNAGRAAAP